MLVYVWQFFILQPIGCKIGGVRKKTLITELLVSSTSMTEFSVIIWLDQMIQLSSFLFNVGVGGDRLFLI